MPSDIRNHRVLSNSPWNFKKIRRAIQASSIVASGIGRCSSTFRLLAVGLILKLPFSMGISSCEGLSAKQF